MSVSLSVSSVLCLSHSYALCSLHTCPNIYLSVLCPTHFCFVLFRLYFLFFFASICRYIMCITMCPSTNLSHSYTQCLPYVSVCLSVSLSLFLSLSPSPFVLFYFTSLCRYSMCTIVFVCLSHSCHILVSTLTVRINLVNCVVTHVSLIARPLGCLFVFCV